MTPDDLARVHAAAMDGPRPWSVAEFADLLAHPGALVAGDGRAFALGRVVLDETEILMVATDPAHRRRGLARARLAALHDAAAERGARRIFLEVDADNAGARALYTAAGYVKAGRRRAYYAHADRPASDAIVMVRDLPPFPAAPVAT